MPDTYPIHPLTFAPVWSKEEWIAWLAVNPDHPAIEQARMDAYVSHGIR